MKKFIVILFLIITILCCISCSEVSANNPKDFGPYVIIKQEGDSTFDPTGYSCTFYLMYDRDTRIVYRYLSGKGRDITPYYVIGPDGQAHMAKWEDGRPVPIMP